MSNTTRPDQFADFDSSAPRISPLSGRREPTLSRRSSCRGALLFAGLGLCLCLTLTAPAGTVAFWRFEAENPAADFSGNGNDLALTAITMSSDVAANAPGSQSASFDGSAYAQTMAPLALSGYKALTVEFFAKYSSSTLDMFFAHNDPNANVGAFYLDINEAAGQIKFSQSTAGGWQTRTGPYPTDGAWHHYALTIDETGSTPLVKLYVDGVAVDNAGTTGGIQAFRDEVMTIGAFPNLAYNFHGQMDEMRISSRVLPTSGFLIAPPLVNAAIVISQQPTNTSTLQSRSADFTVSATLNNGDPALLEYQWQRDGVDIPGATDVTFTLPVATLADNGAQFRVVISTPSVTGVAPVTSASATLSVTSETVPPVAQSTFALASTVVGVRFSEALDPATANDPARYTLDQGASVDSATLQPDGVTVMLGVSGLAAPQYTLTCSGVTDLAGNPGTNSVTGQNLGLTFLDIGMVNHAGTLLYSDPTQYTVTAGGFDMGYNGGTTDGFNFIYKPISGDFDLRVQMTAVSNANFASTGGVMVREDASETSRNVAVWTYGPNSDNHWVLSTRMENGGNTIIPGYPAKGYDPREPGFGFPNAWLRITRLGEIFAAYHSTNGVDWVLIGDPIAPSQPYPQEVLVGIASSAKTIQGNHPVDFQYSNFSAGPPLSPTNAAVVINGQPANQSVIERRAAVFSVEASITNGDPALIQYQWKANGLDIPGATSSTYRVPETFLTDNGTQYRVVVSAPGVTPVTSSPAVLTVLADSVPPQATSAYALVTTMINVQFNEVLDPNSANNSGAYSVGQTGVTIDAATLQPDGTNVTLNVSGLTSPQFQLTFTGIADLSGNLASGTVSGINEGLIFLDIGRVDQNGILASATPEQYTVSAGGYDMGGALGGADGLNFIYRSFSGDFDLRVRLRDMRDFNVSSTGGLMVREDISDISRHVAALTYGPGGDNHWVAATRMETGGPTTIPGYPASGYQEREPGFAFPNAWLRITRVGQIITSHYSTNGLRWVQLGIPVTPSPAFPNEVLVGMASSAKTVQGDHLVTYVYSDFTVQPYQGEPPGEVPTLAIRLAGQEVVMAWPIDATGFTLQQTAALGSPWAAVSATPVQTGDTWEVRVPLAEGARFFRLAQ